MDQSSHCRRTSSGTRVEGIIERVDLLLVRRGEKVTVNVPLRLVGRPQSGRSGDLRF